MGDFNLLGINWIANGIVDRCLKLHESESLLDLVNELYLYHHVQDNTRLSESGANLVDLIVSSENSLVSNFRFYPPLCGRYHNVLIFNFKVGPPCVKHSKGIYMYDKTKGEDVTKVIESWKDIFSLNKSVDCLWSNFRRMHESILMCVPRKKVTVRRGFAYRSNPIFKSAVKNKRRLWLVYSNNPSTWINYKQGLSKVAKLHWVTKILLLRKIKVL